MSASATPAGSSPSRKPTAPSASITAPNSSPRCPAPPPSRSPASKPANPNPTADAGRHNDPMLADHTQLWQLLRSLDDPANLEFPAGYRHREARTRFEQ